MDTMDLDVEMDVDVDLVPDEPIIPELELRDATRERSPGEIDDEDTILIPSKVHIRGLDTMNPEEVKTYVAEHFPEEPIERIEWINDSSANLLFGSDTVGTRALSFLAAEEIQDINQLPLLKLIPAKPFSKKPEVMLQIRLAVASDKKQAGAAQRSRFYLLNPEYDPEERRRRSEARRYRDRDSDSYNRRRTREARNREAEEQFDVSLYDDHETTLSNPASLSRPRRRQSYTPDSSDEKWGTNSYRNENRGKELFPTRPSSRGESRRERSASPRDRDDDQTMDISNGASAARNRERARAIKSRISRSNRSRELFPGKSAAGSGRLGDDVEDTTTLLAKGIMLPLMDERSDVPVKESRRLEDRITGPRKDKLADRVSRADDMEDSGFNIRGSASQRSTNQGFAIKGNAGKTAKELFPEKLGINSGKELFADRMDGRTRQRQRAGDLFD
ncbi:hypothetical protein GGS26DRAFT_573588 [Hypomontagnella submonticulosa]|nr:hypothetical protein GGS26DRAFT_573588 [Hypomontagnella submonticulosa]